MKILVLGGTEFLGRHVVEQARARGHELTLLNRGRRNPALFPEIERIVCDRRDLRPEDVRGRRWDAVVDTSGFVPSAVARSAAVLADAIGHYTFVSSVTVYERYAPGGVTEEAPLAAATDEAVAAAEQIEPPARTTPANGYGDVYGALKARCEAAAEHALPGRVLTIRPGIIAGPWDYSDRLGYWLARVARGGTVLSAGPPERVVRLIDVRDLAGWILRGVEASTVGTYNAIGAAGTDMRRILDVCSDVTGTVPEVVWADEHFLHREGVEPFVDLPLWPSERFRHMFETDDARAVGDGLTFRALEATARDTWEWEQSRSPDERRLGGLEAEREAELVRRWTARPTPQRSEEEPLRFARTLLARLHQRPLYARLLPGSSVVLTGSWCTGASDRFSDVDLFVIAPADLHAEAYREAVASGVTQPGGDWTEWVREPYDVMFKIRSFDEVEHELETDLEVALRIFSLVDVWHDPGGRYAAVVRRYEQVFAERLETLVREKTYFLRCRIKYLEDARRRDLPVTYALIRHDFALKLYELAFLLERKPYPYIKWVEPLAVRETVLGARVEHLVAELLSASSHADTLDAMRRAYIVARDVGRELGSGDALLTNPGGDVVSRVYEDAFLTGAARA